MPRNGGVYTPDADVVWTCVTPDHHIVWLWVLKPGNVHRRRVRIGEVRRHAQKGKGRKHWRAFPEHGGVGELLDNHFLALRWLKDAWEARSVMSQVTTPKHASTSKPAESEPWEKFLGGNPWEQAS